MKSGYLKLERNEFRNSINDGFEIDYKDKHLLQIRLKVEK